MKTIGLSTTILGTMFALLTTAPHAQAQATRTWVSATGSDANPCSRTAPCQTFAGAISKTAVNGIIDCIDAGAFGTVTITKSITIDCHELFAGSLASATTGITINLSTTLALDPRQTVRLRNLNIDGTGSCGAGCGNRTGTRGINILKANHVFIEDTMIQGFLNEGIRDARTVTGTLYIKNVQVRDNSLNGISIVAVAPAVVAAVIEDTQSNLNAFGIAVANGNKVMVKRSVFTGNTTAGVRADSGGQLSVNDSVISSNITGVDAPAGSIIRLSNNDIAFNTTGVSGATTSFGNNRIYPTVGTAPTPAGADSHDKGQQ
jgi:hypothetical protein